VIVFGFLKPHLNIGGYCWEVEVLTLGDCWMWYSCWSKEDAINFLVPLQILLQFQFFFHASSMTLYTSWGKKNPIVTEGRLSIWSIRQVAVEFWQLCSTL